jgi:hypothetical protein
MKLRNKKTGEIKEWQRVGAIDYGELNEVYDSAEYNSLAELNDEWEDYNPVEPLIEDEKIRKAVRAWAEACGAEQVKYAIACNQYYDVRGTGFSIKFLYKPVEVWMEDGKIYTITELCGEEEEDAGN